MKKFIKIGGIAICVLFLLGVGAYGYLMIEYPKDQPIPELKIVPTAEMIERGKYLSETSFSCLDCHSMRDPRKNVDADSTRHGIRRRAGYWRGSRIHSRKNITPDFETGIGSWTDGEIFRAITAGISKDGSFLSPNMPYLAFRDADSLDIIAIIAYLRTVKPIHNPVPERDIDFPLSFIFRTLPTSPELTPLDTNDPLAVGKYIGKPCFMCHTPNHQGEFKMDEMFSGGVEFPMPFGGTVRTANITPDRETGIGSWSKEMFIKKFKSYQDVHALPKTGPNEFNTAMPWSLYANISEKDLAAIYDFLRTVPPVKKKVEKFTPSQMPQSNRK